MIESEIKKIRDIKMSNLIDFTIPFQEILSEKLRAKELWNSYEIMNIIAESINEAFAKDLHRTVNYLNLHRKQQ